MTKTTVALGQMLVVPGDPQANLKRALDFIADAAHQGADVLVLPECMDLGWTHPQATLLASSIPGPFSDLLCEAARAHRIHVAVGLTEREGERLFNTALLISSTGEILLKHRKINELDFARRLYQTGTSLAVTETPFGVVGLNICADNSPDSVFLGHALGKMGARLLLSPSAWAVPPSHDNHTDPYGSLWEGSYRELALGNGMAVIGVSNVGPVIGGEWDGWQCIGCSLVVGKDGTVLAKGPYGADQQALLLVEV